PPPPSRKSRRLASPSSSPRPKKSYAELPSPASRLNRPPVTSLASLRSYALRLGSEHGSDEVLWADSFAFEVLAEELRLAVLFVDMEREGGSSPYRLLSSSKEQAPLRYLVLLRESVGHFNLLTWSPPGAAAGPAGQIGAFTFGEGRGEPEVVRVLWGVPPL
ncbi:hypothetical protein TeGR_g3092, partial [Tetraparma gracilis]